MANGAGMSCSMCAAGTHNMHIWIQYSPLLPPLLLAIEYAPRCGLLAQGK
jgi:hypothetical protein